MKVICFGGVPCSGKTTLMKRFIQRNMEDATPFAFGLVKGSFKGDLILVGIYDDARLFSGTDRLSMAVQPVFLRWLKAMHKQKPHCRIVFEGDRLFTEGVLSFIRANEIDLTSIVLDVGNKERERRKKLRGDSQTDKFIQGRRTKYENLINKGLATRVFHETPEDTQFLLEKMEQDLL